MSDAESFLRRWSRRKSDAAAPAPDVGGAAASAAPADGVEPSGASSAARQRPSEAAPIDPATLPPIESITAGCDIRAFFRPGVPAELTRAALRRAWIADPLIRDFVGLSENSWDFNAPGGAPGFGPLRSTDDLARLAAQVLGGEPTRSETGSEGAASAREPAAQPTVIDLPAEPGDAGGTADRERTEMSEPRSDESSNVSVPFDGPRESVELGGTQDQASADEKALLRRHRRHGRALPK
jgi:Protein of unknown function (DUF3306)